MKTFAVILSGCGVFDGAEIHEATLSLYAIAKQGHSYAIFAPDMDQHHVMNHLTGKEMNEQRNVLVESARIARGKIAPLSDLDPSKYDALLMPGGFGVAKNLSDWAFKGGNAEILPDLVGAIKGMVAQGKPIGALCIAPVILAKVLGDVELTIGNDKGTIEAIESVGASHKVTSHGEVVVDRKYRVVTTPCYMLDATIDQIGIGAENVVRTMIDLMS